MTALLASLLGVSLVASVLGQATGSEFDAYALVERGGLVGALFLVVVGFLREWWVPGPQYKRVDVERARLQTLLEKSIPLLARATEQLSKLHAPLDDDDIR